jgi:hypothetical protein
LALGGCHGTPAVAVPPPPARVPDAVAWHADEHAVRARLVGDDQIEVGVDAFAPERIVLDQKVRVTRLALIDATGDGRPDLVVWFDPASLGSDASPRSQYVFRVERDRGTLRFDQDEWTEAALGVLADDAALRAAVPKLRTFAFPDETIATELIVLRMRFATASDFRALVADAGLELCDENSGNATPHGKHCNHYTKTEITDAVFADRIKQSETSFFGMHSCSRTRGLETCTLETGGPSLLDFVFIGQGAARRLREINSVAFENT